MQIQAIFLKFKLSENSDNRQIWWILPIYWTKSFAIEYFNFSRVRSVEDQLIDLN